MVSSCFTIWVNGTQRVIQLHPPVAPLSAVGAHAAQLPDTSGWDPTQNTPKKWPQS